VAQIANTFILRRHIGELLELGARKIAFFERNEVHSSPLLKHENEFYRVKKGDLFGMTARDGDLSTVRSFVSSRMRVRMLVRREANPAQQSNRVVVPFVP